MSRFGGPAVTLLHTGPQSSTSDSPLPFPWASSTEPMSEYSSNGDTDVDDDGDDQPFHGFKPAESHSRPKRNTKNPVRYPVIRTTSHYFKVNIDANFFITNTSYFMIILDVPIPINIGITFSTTTPRRRHVSKKKLDVKTFPFDSSTRGH